MAKFIDLTGKKFSNLTVTEKIKDSSLSSRCAHWRCICDCGNSFITRSDLLREGDSKSCGCLKNRPKNIISVKEYLENKTTKRRVKLEGRKFNKLKVLKFTGTDKHCASLFECICDCGNITIVRGVHLLNENTKTCGCLQKEVTRKRVSLEKGEACFNQVFASYKKSAKRKNIDFDLIKEEFRSLTQNNCFYCNSEPSNIKKAQKSNGEYRYNGLDRIDNSRGYTMDNIVSCCENCNKAKRDLSIDDFLKWAMMIAKNIHKAELIFKKSNLKIISGGN